MINPFSQKKISNNSQIPTIINSSLPIIIKVLEKTGYHRYNLKFGNKNLSTKSLKELEIGSEYYANINSQSGGVININGLIKRNVISEFLDDGTDLLQKVLNSKSLEWLFNFIKLKLANSLNEKEFKIYTDMVLALNEHIISIPFLYEKEGALIQIELSKIIGVYLDFDRFVPFKALIKNGKFIKIASAYPNFNKTLSEALNCPYDNIFVEAFWSKKGNLLDFKG